MQKFNKVSISIETANKLNRLKDKLVAVPTSTSKMITLATDTLEKVYKNAKEIRELQK